MDSDPESQPTDPVAPPKTLRGRLKRYAWLAAGWFFFSVGIVGIALPALPTTGPMLLALACFSRGSDRLHNWLLNHPRFGRSVRHWHEHRVIPIRAKAVALSMMAASFVYLGWFSRLPPWVSILVCGFIVVGAIVVIRLPHRIAAEAPPAPGHRQTSKEGSPAAATDD